MRLFEFAGNEFLSVITTVLSNYIETSAFRTSPAKLNYLALTNMMKNNGLNLKVDYNLFKNIYDSSPVIQNIVHNFDGDGIDLNVPGVKKEKEQSNKEKSKDAVEKTAAANAEKNLS